MSRMDDALVALDQARALQENLSARHPEMPELRNHVAGTDRRIALLLAKRGRLADAAAAYEHARALLVDLTRDYPDKLEFRTALAETLFALGTNAFRAEDY